jgi:hypothetical protein
MAFSRSISVDYTLPSSQSQEHDVSPSDSSMYSNQSLYQQSPQPSKKTHKLHSRTHRSMSALPNVQPVQPSGHISPLMKSHLQQQLHYGSMFRIPKTHKHRTPQGKSPLSANTTRELKFEQYLGTLPRAANKPRQHRKTRKSTLNPNRNSNRNSNLSNSNNSNTFNRNAHRL